MTLLPKQYMTLGVKGSRNRLTGPSFPSPSPARFNYDLNAWRKGSAIPVREFEVLDADNGAGWALLGSMLRERAIETDDEGTVTFSERSGRAPRISAPDALRHRSEGWAFKASYIRKSRFSSVKALSWFRI